MACWCAGGHLTADELSDTDISAHSADIDIRREIHQRLDRISAVFHQSTQFKYVYSPNPRSATEKVLNFQPATPKDLPRLNSYLSIFELEISKYPDQFFRSIGLKRIIFVKNLFYKELPAQGLYNDSTKTLYFNFSDTRGGRLALRHNVHHEIYHVIHSHFDINPDDTWHNLNIPDFKYTHRGRHHQVVATQSENYFSPDIPGFVTDYAMTSAEEDQAEVFACLFIQSQSRLMHKWAVKDEVLANKIRFIKQALLDISDQVINESYWHELNR